MNPSPVKNQISPESRNDYSPVLKTWQFKILHLVRWISYKNFHLVRWFSIATFDETGGCIHYYLIMIPWVHDYLITIPIKPYWKPYYSNRFPSAKFSTVPLVPLQKSFSFQAPCWLPGLIWTVLLGWSNIWIHLNIYMCVCVIYCNICVYIIFYSIIFFSILFYSIYFILYYIIFFSIRFYSILLNYIILYSIIFYSIIFFSILFYYIILYYILFYSILFYYIIL